MAHSLDRNRCPAVATHRRKCETISDLCFSFFFFFLRETRNSRRYFNIPSNGRTPLPVRLSFKNRRNASRATRLGKVTLKTIRNVARVTRSKIERKYRLGRMTRNGRDQVFRVAYLPRPAISLSPIFFSHLTYPSFADAIRPRSHG